MKYVNIKHKTENSIRIFKDWLSTVGEHRNPEYIGVEELYMHLARFFFQLARNSNRFTNSIPCNVSKLPSVYILVMANVDIYAIVSTIENYENRTVNPIFVSNNSVQSTLLIITLLSKSLSIWLPFCPTPEEHYSHAQISREM